MDRDESWFCSGPLSKYHDQTPLARTAHLILDRVDQDPMFAARRESLRARLRAEFLAAFGAPPQ
jgi:hypothetical protein